MATLGDEVTILTPHTKGLAEGWNDDGLEVRTFRYAPESMEVLGYSRSLNADEKPKWSAAAVSPLYLYRAKRALADTVQGHDVDLVHAHWAVPNGLVAAAARVSVPFGVGLHGSDVFMAEKSSVRPFMRRALSRASFLTGCSPELVDRICALGFPSDQSTVIPYGVNTDQFTPDAPRRRIWREKLQIPEDSPVILTVGRMVTKKGFQVLLEALPSVLRAVPSAHAVLAGGGDRFDEFQRLAATISDRIHFPGVVLRDTLPDLYRAADIFVLPAVHDAKGNVDGLPNVILEAMSSGLPVIASKISGIPLAVRDRTEGVLVPEQDSTALGSALRELLDNRPICLQMGKAARQRALSELTWGAVASRYRSAYLAVVGKPVPDPKNGSQ